MVLPAGTLTQLHGRLLLDRLGINWKSRATSEPLDRLLAEAVGTSQPQAADMAYRRYGYDRLLTESPSSWGGLAVMSESAFDALAPYRLVLDLPPGAKMGWSLTTSPKEDDSGMHRPAPRIVLLPMVKRFTVNDDGVSVLVEQRPVKMIRQENEASRPIVTVLLAEPPVLDGKRSSVFAVRDSGFGARGSGLESFYLAAGATSRSVSRSMAPVAAKLAW